MGKGNTYVKMGRYNDALTAFDKSISFDPNNEFSWLSKSIVLNNLGRNKEAIECAEKAKSIK